MFFLLLCAILQVTKVYWDFRKGLIPIIGGSRYSTTVLAAQQP
jgi:hypothetical protein